MRLRNVEEGRSGEGEEVQNGNVFRGVALGLRADDAQRR